MRRRQSGINPDRLIDLIYDAAFDADVWPDVLRAVAEATGGTNVILLTWPDFADANCGDWRAHEIDPCMFGPYRDYYGRLDIAERAYKEWLRRTGRRSGVFNFDAPEFQRLLSREEFVGSAIYNEFWAPQGFGGLAGIGVAPEPRLEMPQIYLSIFRRPHDDAFSAATTQTLQTLAPHLRRALHLQARLAQHARTAEGALAALDRLTVGVALLDDAGRVVHLNAAAERIVRQGDGLAVVEGCLKAPGRCDRPLQAALAAPKGAAFALQRPSGLRDYLIVVTPARGDALAMGRHRPAKIVFITDSETRPVLREELLRQLWRLTAAEARVAASLLDGLSPKEIADRDAVSEATVRTQIRAILAKTGTTRQADFLRLAAGLGFQSA
ncbi:MAG TPA: helix-turn-helix transcriptional regulator [Alphaproteobacteria bacterium]